MIGENPNQKQKKFLSDDESDFDEESLLIDQVDFEIYPVDSVDEGETSIPPPPKVSLQVPESHTVDFYLFHVHEEGQKLYLFGKHRVGNNFYTICIEVANTYYYLQFLPIIGHEFEIAEEVNDIAHKCGGRLISKEMKEHKYSFDNSLIPQNATYLCATFSSNSNCSKIKPNGIHYSHVFGVTASLSENFFVRRHVYCPSWVRATNCQKKSRSTTVPMLSVTNIESISPISISDSSVYLPSPPMNLCTISIRSMFHTNEIYMISARILYEWDIDEFSGKGTKSTTLVCSTSGGAISPEIRQNDHIELFRTEEDLLSYFVRLIDDYDIDILVSFGLISNDIPLLFNRLKTQNVKEWWKIGRLRRATTIKDGKINPTYALSGRIPCDIRISCIDQMRAKSNDLSAAVYSQFGFERQQIDHYEIVHYVSDLEKLTNLINYNSRDTLFVAQLLNAREILPLALHIAQLSGCQWSRVLLNQVSFCCEALLLRAFYDRGFVLPDKCVTNQPKYPAFPGGLVLQPKRGFYETCIVALDYCSLYPSIIIEYNICFTTLDLKNPKAEDSKKSKIKGVLPQIMLDLLDEREKVKAKIVKLIEKLNEIEPKIKKFKESSKNKKRSQNLILSSSSESNDSRSDDIGVIFTEKSKFVQKKTEFEQSLSSEEMASQAKIKSMQKIKIEIELELQRLNTKQEAIKVLANAMYGYLGYRHSRFLANGMAALIAQQGREILQRTVEIVEKSGKDSIIYGDTDSVMINSGTADPIAALAKGKEIAEIVTSQFDHLRFGVEGVFLKMLVVSKKRYVALVYDGPGKSHQLTKGIELIRRDWCGLTKYVSAYILEQFLYSSDKDTAISSILGELSRISKMLRNNGEVPNSDKSNHSSPPSSNYPSSDRNVDVSYSYYTASTSASSVQSLNSKGNKSAIKASTSSTTSSSRNSNSSSNNGGGSDSILPAVCFPQMYGAQQQKMQSSSSSASSAASSPSRRQLYSQKQKQQQLKDMNVKIKDLHSNVQSTVAILREYGISTKFAPTQANNNKGASIEYQGERIAPIERITIEHLIIHMTLTKGLDKYQDRMSPHVMVALRMQDRGEHITPHTTIEFVITNFNSREIGEKARIPDEINSISECDAEWYLSNQLLAPIWRLCEPFGSIDASMIARALGLSIPQTYGLPERDECVAVVVPHSTELYYNCVLCNEVIYIVPTMKNNFKCPKCNYVHNWKLVANKLTLFIRSFLSKTSIFKCNGNLCDFQTVQLPMRDDCQVHHNSKCDGKLKNLYSCVNIFNTLKYFKSIFVKSNNPEDDDFLQFREYMMRVINEFLDCHGFMRIQLNTIFSYSSSSSESKEETASESSARPIPVISSSPIDFM